MIVSDRLSVVAAPRQRLSKGAFTRYINTRKWVEVIDLEASLLKTQTGIVHGELTILRDEFLPAVLAESLPAVMSDLCDHRFDASAFTNNLTGVVSK